MVSENSSTNEVAVGVFSRFGDAPHATRGVYI
jgi:hypothetical protein